MDQAIFSGAEAGRWSRASLAKDLPVQDFSECWVRESHRATAKNRDNTELLRRGALGSLLEHSDGRGESALPRREDRKLNLTARPR